MSTERKSKEKGELDMTLIQQAKEFAQNAHEGQVRKLTGTPMFEHLERVAEILKNAGLPDEVVAAGYLHDTVEDTNTTPEDILNAFGQDVAFIVSGHTEDKTKSWEERKQTTIDELADPNTPLSIRALIIADRLDNLRSYKKGLDVFGEEMWSKFKRGRKEQEWYFRGCLEQMNTGLKVEEIPSFFYDYEKEVNEFFV